MGRGTERRGKLEDGGQGEGAGKVEERHARGRDGDEGQVGACRYSKALCTWTTRISGRISALFCHHLL
jgi:hypothetical protein